MTARKGARQSAAIPLVVILLGAFAVVAIWLGVRPATSQIIFHAYPPRYGVEELTARAAVIAEVRLTGARHSHWNSATNSQWQAPEGSGLVAMIVTDFEARVVRGIRGVTDGDVINVRTIGGTVGSTEFVDVDASPLSTAESYLVFLGRDDWRGQDVVDRGILSPVGGMQAVYIGNDQSGYLNREGLFLSANVVEDLAR